MAGTFADDVRLHGDRASRTTQLIAIGTRDPTTLVVGILTCTGRPMAGCSIEDLQLFQHLVQERGRGEPKSA